MRLSTRRPLQQKPCHAGVGCIAKFHARWLRIAEHRRDTFHALAAVHRRRARSQGGSFHAQVAANRSKREGELDAQVSAGCSKAVPWSPTNKSRRGVRATPHMSTSRCKLQQKPCGKSFTRKSLLVAAKPVRRVSRKVFASCRVAAKPCREFQHESLRVTAKAGW